MAIIQEDGMKGQFWHVWIKNPSGVHLDEIIKAGIEALSVDAELEETDYQDEYEG